MADILNPAFANEDKARRYLEAQRWPNGPVCPFCRKSDAISALKPNSKTGKGWYECRLCRATGDDSKFTVRVGTIYERSHIPLHKWLLATHLLTSSKKGISSHQLHRMLGVTYKTAWFMAHRIREGMKPTTPPTLGGEGKIVEADETYMGKRKGRPSWPSTFVSGFGWVQPPPYKSERKIISLVERGGPVISFHVDSVNTATVKDVLFRHADRKSELMTDQAPVYVRAGWQYAAHYSVNHSQEEWVRDYAHTNTIEGYFSIFKRGMRGVYQHCGEQHLHRYLAEFDFRYSNRAALGIDDVARMQKAVKGIEGKRLTYRRIEESRFA
jgi:transposase-like protein